MSEQLFVERRFVGPPGTANGGYVSGLLATSVGEPAEVTLIAPPPVERALRVEAGELFDGSTLVARARSAELELELPEPVSFEQAEQFSGHFAWKTKHPFPYCFVCGPARAPGDGLRIFAGRAEASGPVAAPFVPDASLADADGAVRREMLWAALDCPGYFGAMTSSEPAVLGRITAELVLPVRVGARLVVLGWSLGSEGRKRFAATALFTEDGTLVGRSRQTWLVLARGA